MSSVYKSTPILKNHEVHAEKKTLFFNCKDMASIPQSTPFFAFLERWCVSFSRRSRGAGGHRNYPISVIIQFPIASHSENPLLV